MSRRIAALTMLVLVAGAGSVLAAGGDSAGITVNAEVVGTCKFSLGNPSTINLTLDPAVGGTVSQQIIPTFWCTKGVTYTIGDDNGMHESGTTFRLEKASAPTEHIPYSFTYSAASATGNGKTNPIGLTIIASVDVTDYQNASFGTDWADTVTITIAP